MLTRESIEHDLRNLTMLSELSFYHAAFAGDVETISTFIHSTIEQYVREVVGKKEKLVENCPRASKLAECESCAELRGRFRKRNEILQSSAERGYPIK
jgi:hypothetical protein